MIISIRATSGAGKSYLVRRLMRAAGPAEEILELGMIIGYQGKTFRLVGPYDGDRICTGADRLSEHGPIQWRRAEVFALIEKWAADSKVLYEGLLLANEVNRTVALAAKIPTKIIFLTTPLEECLAAINQRRQVRSVSLFDETVEPVNPKKTTEKYAELQRVANRLEAAGVDVERLDREVAYQRVHQLLFGLTE
jgi:hypothetical protein